MLNLNSCTDESFEFFQSVLENKYNTRNDIGYKDRVRNLYPEIEPLHQNYDNHFTTNTLLGLAAHGYDGQSKIDLQKLYSYKSSVIQKLKSTVTTTATNRIINTCQNCTINSVDSMDHILPQSTFAEFIVHPKNLFPSCTECNRIKNNVYDLGDNRRFLNLYLDSLPDSQYLFVRIEPSLAGIYPVFTLANPNGVPAELFLVLSTHYQRLGLLSKFSLNSDKVITKLVNSLRPGIGRRSREELVHEGSQVANLNQISFGRNFWESILEIGLLNSDLFWNIL